ncbi:hypothetical protein BDV12DRAFT_166893 [Aspergillus spectabilis]
MGLYLPWGEAAALFRRRGAEGSLSVWITEHFKDWERYHPSKRIQVFFQESRSAK